MGHVVTIIIIIYILIWKVNKAMNSVDIRNDSIRNNASPFQEQIQIYFNALQSSFFQKTEKQTFQFKLALSSVIEQLCYLRFRLIFLFNPFHTQYIPLHSTYLCSFSSLYPSRCIQLGNHTYSILLCSHKYDCSCGFPEYIHQHLWMTKTVLMSII